MALTVLVPAYNEERMIKKSVLVLLKYLKSLKTDFEIIICVNASTDRTESIAKELSRMHREVRYISIKRKGFGVALIEGIKAAKKSIITYMPSDNEIVLDFIERALGEIKDYDLVSGSRYLRGSTQSSNLFRVFLSSAYAKLIKMLFSFKITEFGTVKMFRADWAKKIVNELTPSHWEFQVEVLYLALRDGKRIKEIPIRVNYQEERESTVNIFSDIISLFKSAIKYGIRLRMRQLFH